MTSQALERRLIDDFLPDYDVVERHEIRVSAPVEAAFDAVLDLDLARSPVIATLLAVRGLPQLFTRRPRLTRRIDLAAIEHAGFVRLAEEPPHQIVLGVVGRFWHPWNNVGRIAAEEFTTFDEPDFSKGVWDFTVEPDGDNRSIVRTETRVLCTDDSARRKFRAYWRLVGPFSSLIRILLLRSIRGDAERRPASS
jgi:hypothetical protein